MMEHGKGMSRAAQKKRKREKKEKIRQHVGGRNGKNEILLDEIQNSETWEDNSNADEETEAVKRPKMDESAVFTRDFPILTEFQDLSLLDTLFLRDVKEIDAKSRSALILSKLLQPVGLEKFYTDFWLKSILFSRQEEGDPAEVQCLGSKQVVKKIFKENLLKIDEDICIVNSKSEVLGDIPQSSQDYYRFYMNGSSLVLLQPQKYDDMIWKLFSALEFEFNCRVDGKLILIPKGNLFYEETYGADRFIIQLDGRTDCRAPTEAMDIQGFLSIQEEDSTVRNTLRQSGLLYIPQGFPMELLANDTPSLVLVIYTNRENKVSDLLEFVFPTAINNLKQQMNLLSSTLPSNIYSFLGVAHSENENDRFRNAFFSLLQTCNEAVAQEIVAITDPAVDQLAKKFIMERLPVPLTEQEEQLSYSGFPTAIIYSYTQLRMIRPGIAITVVEDGKCVVYHCMDNSRELFGNPINPLEFDLDDGPAIEALLKAYPDPITVSDLEHPSDEIDDKIGIAEALFKEGILMIMDVASQPDNVLSQEEDGSDDGGLL